MFRCCDGSDNTNSSCKSNNSKETEREETSESVNVADDTQTCSCKQWLLLLLFPFLIAAVTVIMTMAYYYVRIRFLDFADAAVKQDESIYSIYNDTEYDDHEEWNEFISNITEYRDNATINAPHLLHHNENITYLSNYYNDDDDKISEYHTYHEAYWVLRPGMTLINQSLPNPALTKNLTHTQNKESHSTLSSSSNEEPLHKEQQTNIHVEHKRRYVLDGLERGKRYMLRLCYLGSPSVWYQVNFLHVRQSFITQTIDMAKMIRRHKVYNYSTEVELKEEKNRHKQVETVIDTQHDKNNDDAFHLLDTEVRMLSMHAIYPRQFAWDGIVIETESWPESIRVGNVNSSFSNSSFSSSSSSSSSAHHRDAFVAVIEIIPHVLAETVSPENFPLITYNIHLSTLTANFLPDVAFPYILTISLIVFLPLYVALQNTNLQLADVRHGFFIFSCIKRLLYVLLSIVCMCLTVLPTLCANVLLSATKQPQQKQEQQQKGNTHKVLQENQITSDDSSVGTSDTKCDNNSQEMSRVMSLTRKANLDDSVKVTSEYILSDDIQLSHPFSTSSSEAPSSTSFQLPTPNASTSESSQHK